MKPRISIVVAVARNGVIGRDNALPWRLSEDLKRFKRITTGKPVVMGRKTWESIGRPLLNRTNIIITSQRDYAAEGAIVVHSLEDAIEAAGENTEEIMVIGGATLYEKIVSIANQIYLTRVEADIPGDTYFPRLYDEDWREVERLEVPTDEKNEYKTTYLVLERKTDSNP